MTLEFWCMGISELQKSPLSLLHVYGTDCLGSVLSWLSLHPGCGPRTLHISSESIWGLYLVNCMLYQSSAFRITGHRFPTQGSIYFLVCFCSPFALYIGARQEESSVGYLLYPEAQGYSTETHLKLCHSLIALVCHLDLCKLTHGARPE